MIELAEAIAELAKQPINASHATDPKVFNSVTRTLRAVAWRLETGQLTDEFYAEEDKITEKANEMRNAVPKMVMPNAEQDAAQHAANAFNTASVIMQQAETAYNLAARTSPELIPIESLTLSKNTEAPMPSKDFCTRPALVPIAVEILQECISVLRERGTKYADIEDNSNVFTEIMSAFIAPLPMSPTNYHCLSNIATKLARFATGDQTHEDTFIDIANYAVLMCAVTRRNKMLAAMNVIVK